MLTTLAHPAKSGFCLFFPPSLTSCSSPVAASEEEAPGADHRVLHRRGPGVLQHRQLQLPDGHHQWVRGSPRTVSVPADANGLKLTRSPSLSAGMNMSPVARLKKTWSKVNTDKFEILEVRQPSRWRHGRFLTERRGEQIWTQHLLRHVSAVGCPFVPG